MKIKKLIIILAILLFPGAATASEWFTPFTNEDWGYQLTHTTLAVVDWRQTQIATKDSWRRERNFVLGDHPSRTRVDVLIGGGIIAHGLISWALPPRPRRFWQCFWIGIEMLAVRNNYQLGVTISF